MLILISKYMRNAQVFSMGKNARCSLSLGEGGKPQYFQVFQKCHWFTGAHPGSSGRPGQQTWLATAMFCLARRWIALSDTSIDDSESFLFPGKGSIQDSWLFLAHWLTWACFSNWHLVLVTFNLVSQLRRTKMLTSEIIRSIMCKEQSNIYKEDQGIRKV